MGRTARAALLAGVIGFVAVAGLGAFLVPGAALASVVAGLVVGALSALLILGAARRADSFQPTTPVRPSHPGPPEPAADQPDTDEPDTDDVAGTDEDDRV